MSDTSQNKETQGEIADDNKAGLPVRTLVFAAILVFLGITFLPKLLLQFQSLFSGHNDSPTLLFDEFEGSRPSGGSSSGASSSLGKAPAEAQLSLEERLAVAVDESGISTPSQQSPAVAQPAMEVPQLEAPTLPALPTLELPKLEAPELPELKAPSVALPTVGELSSQEDLLAKAQNLLQDS